MHARHTLRIRTPSMGKVRVTSTDPLSSCKELTNKKMHSIDTCWWLDVFLTVLCTEYSIYKCICTASKLSTSEEGEIMKVKEGVFLHGMPLFHLDTRVNVHHALMCSSPMQATDYSVHCENSNREELLDNDKVKELLHQYHAVRPISEDCNSSGKAILTRGSNVLARDKK